MEELEGRIAHLIIDTLNLEEISANEIDPKEPLFGDGFGLDSIDALEIGIAVQKTFGIKVDAQDENLPTYFSSIQELARFVARQQAEEGKT